MLSSNIVKLLDVAVLLAFSCSVFGQSAAPAGNNPAANDKDHAVLNAMSQELERNFSGLKAKGDPPPYFMSYEITDQDQRNISATLGVLNVTEGGRNRNLDVSVRVGSPALDNYRRVRGDRIQFTGGVSVPLDDNTTGALRQDLWLETDRIYRAAAERLIKIKTNQQVKTEDRDKSNDFSSEEAYAHWEPVSRLKIDTGTWTQNVRELSREFVKYPDLLSSNVQVSFLADNRYFANTEGTKVEHGRDFARVIITASAKAKDGMDVSDFASFEAADPNNLPSSATIRATVDKVGKNVEALRTAKVAEPFVGPAILSGRASGVFFHEIFGHRIEGHRQKDESEGQTFTQSVGEKILPDFLSVTFDPTIKRIAGVDLNGYYEYDDEGVQARPVLAVKDGVLKSFLMSRSPIEGFDHSNGHGRRQPGLEVVSRQSNLIVSSTHSVSDQKLREMLIAEIRKQNKPYGLYFEDITSGVTTTGRAGLQAFKVVPVIVYRVYADGRPDELIRGADIVGTPLASFAKIIATSDKQEVFNGYCGAESGSVPVSAVSPAVLISEIEIEKKDASQDLLPLLPSPLSLSTTSSTTPTSGVQ